MDKDLKFEDAEEMNSKYPDLFHAPGKDELSKLKRGDFVQVCAFGERIWSEVISIDSNIVTARINDILITNSLKYNDVIRFSLNNIYNILSPKRMKAVLKAVNISKTIKRNGKSAKRKI